MLFDSERKPRSKTASRTKTSMTGTLEVWPIIQRSSVSRDRPINEEATWPSPH